MNLPQVYKKLKWGSEIRKLKQSIQRSLLGSVGNVFCAYFFFPTYCILADILCQV